MKHELHPQGFAEQLGAEVTDSGGSFVAEPVVGSFVVDAVVERQDGHKFVMEFAFDAQQTHIGAVAHAASTKAAAEAKYGEPVDGVVATTGDVGPAVQRAAVSLGIRLVAVDPSSENPARGVADQLIGGEPAS